MHFPGVLIAFFICTLHVDNQERTTEPTELNMEAEITTQELLEQADKLARDVLHVSREEAFERLDRGQYQGTIFASEMSAIRFLLESNESTPLAAE